MARMTQKGYGLWNTVTGLGGKVVNFFDSTKSALESGSGAASKNASNASDQIISHIKASGGQVDDTLATAIRNQTNQAANGTLAVVKEGIGGGAPKKLGIWAAGITAVGTALASTGIGHSIWSSVLTMNETSEAEAGQNKLLYGIYGLIQKLLEDFGGDKYLPGLNNFLKDKLNKHKTANSPVGNALNGVEEFVPDQLDGGNAGVATMESGLALGLAGLAGTAAVKGGINAFKGKGGPNGGPTNGGGNNTPPPGDGPDGKMTVAKGEASAAIETVVDNADDTIKGGSGRSKLVRGLAWAGLGTASFFGISALSTTPAEASTGDGVTPTPEGLDGAEKTVMDAMSAGQVVTMGMGVKTVATEGLGLVDDAMKIGAKKIPFVGGAITLAFSGAAAFGYAMNGEWGRAGTELATGTVEAAINTTGLGLLGASDLAREGIRSTVEATMGEQWTPDKSGIRTIFEYATHSGDFAAPAATTPAPTQTASVEPTTPREVFQTAAADQTIFPSMEAAMGGEAPGPMAHFNPNKGTSQMPKANNRNRPSGYIPEAVPA